MKKVADKPSKGWTIEEYLEFKYEAIHQFSQFFKDNRQNYPQFGVIPSVVHKDWLISRINYPKKIRVQKILQEAIVYSNLFMETY